MRKRNNFINGLDPRVSARMHQYREEFINREEDLDLNDIMERSITEGETLRARVQQEHQEVLPLEAEVVREKRRDDPHPYSSLKTVTYIPVKIC